MEIDWHITETQRLIKRFESVNGYVWQPQDYISEIVVQTGHLIDVLLGNSFITETIVQEETFRTVNNPGDELADILFQVIGYMLSIRVDAINNVLSCDKYRGIRDSLSLSETICLAEIVVGRLQDSRMRVERRKQQLQEEKGEEKYQVELCEKLICLLFEVSNQLDLNLAQEYYAMLLDANCSLENREQMGR